MAIMSGPVHDEFAQQAERNGHQLHPDSSWLMPYSISPPQQPLFVRLDLALDDLHGVIKVNRFAPRLAGSGAADYVEQHKPKTLHRRIHVPAFTRNRPHLRMPSSSKRYNDHHIQAPRSARL